MELHLYMCIYSTVHLRTAYRTTLSTIPTVDRGWGTGGLSMLAAGRASRRSQPALMDWGFMQILNFPIELVAAVFRRLEDWHAAEGGCRCMCVCLPVLVYVYVVYGGESAIRTSHIRCLGVWGRANSTPESSSGTRTGA